MDILSFHPLRVPNGSKVVSLDNFGRGRDVVCPDGQGVNILQDTFSLKVSPRGLVNPRLHFTGNRERRDFPSGPIGDVLYSMDRHTLKLYLESLLELKESTPLVQEFVKALEERRLDSDKGVEYAIYNINDINRLILAHTADNRNDTLPDLWKYASSKIPEPGLVKPAVLTLYQKWLPQQIQASKNNEELWIRLNLFLNGMKSWPLFFSPADPENYGKHVSRGDIDVPKTREIESPNEFKPAVEKLMDEHKAAIQAMEQDPVIQRLVPWMKKGVRTQYPDWHPHPEYVTPQVILAIQALKLPAERVIQIIDWMEKSIPKVPSWIEDRKRDVFYGYMDWHKGKPVYFNQYGLSPQGVQLLIAFASMPIGEVEWQNMLPQVADYLKNNQCQTLARYLIKAAPQGNVEDSLAPHKMEPLNDGNIHSFEKFSVSTVQQIERHVPTISKPERSFPDNAYVAGLDFLKRDETRRDFPQERLDRLSTVLNTLNHRHILADFSPEGMIKGLTLLLTLPVEAGEWTSLMEGIEGLVDHAYPSDRYPSFSEIVRNRLTLGAHLAKERAKANGQEVLDRVLSSPLEEAGEGQQLSSTSIEADAPTHEAVEKTLPSAKPQAKWRWPIRIQWNGGVPSIRWSDHDVTPRSFVTDSGTTRSPKPQRFPKLSNVAPCQPWLDEVRILTGFDGLIMEDMLEWSKALPEELTPAVRHEIQETLPRFCFAPNSYRVGEFFPPIKALLFLKSQFDPSSKAKIREPIMALGEKQAFNYDSDKRHWERTVNFLNRNGSSPQFRQGVLETLAQYRHSDFIGADLFSVLGLITEIEPHELAMEDQDQVFKTLRRHLAHPSPFFTEYFDLHQFVSHKGAQHPLGYGERDTMMHNVRQYFNYHRAWRDYFNYYQQYWIQDFVNQPDIPTGDEFAALAEHYYFVPRRDALELVKTYPFEGHPLRLLLTKSALGDINSIDSICQGIDTKTYDPKFEEVLWKNFIGSSWDTPKSKGLERLLFHKLNRLAHTVEAQQMSQEDALKEIQKYYGELAERLKNKKPPFIFFDSYPPQSLESIESLFISIISKIQNSPPELETMVNLLKLPASLALSTWMFKHTVANFLTGTEPYKPGQLRLMVELSQLLHPQQDNYQDMVNGWVSDVLSSHPVPENRQWMISILRGEESALAQLFQFKSRQLQESMSFLTDILLLMPSLFPKHLKTVFEPNSKGPRSSVLEYLTFLLERFSQLESSALIPVHYEHLNQVFSRFSSGFAQLRLNIQEERQVTLSGLKLIAAFPNEKSTPGQYKTETDHAFDVLMAHPKGQGLLLELCQQYPGIRQNVVSRLPELISQWFQPNVPRTEAGLLLLSNASKTLPLSLPSAAEGDSAFPQLQDYSPMTLLTQIMIGNGAALAQFLNQLPLSSTTFQGVFGEILSKFPATVSGAKVTLDNPTSFTQPDQLSSRFDFLPSLLDFSQRIPSTTSGLKKASEEWLKLAGLDKPDIEIISQGGFPLLYAKQKLLTGEESQVIESIPVLFQSKKGLGIFAYFMSGIEDAKRMKRPRPDPNEAEMMLMLRHPQGKDNAQFIKNITLGITYLYDYLRKHHVSNVPRDVVQNWSDIGFLTHSFRFWTYETRGGANSLFAKFGFEPISPRPTDGVFQNGFLLSDPAKIQAMGLPKDTVVEFRRGYMAIAIPGKGALVIRNSSQVFGRDLLSHPAYYSERPYSKEDLLAINQEDLKSSQKWEPILSAKNLTYSPNIKALVQGLLKVKEEFRKWKLDVSQFNERDEFTGIYSQGFGEVLSTLDAIMNAQFLAYTKMRQAKTPDEISAIQMPQMPELGFAFGDYPIFQTIPFAAYQNEGGEWVQGPQMNRLKITAKVLEELHALHEDKWNEYDFPDPTVRSFLETGLNQVNNHPELVLLRPDQTP